PDRDADLEHPPNWRCAFGLPRPVSFNEILTLKCHAVLHSNAAAQRLHALDVAIADCFAVIEEPVQTVKRNLSIDLLVNIQRSLDRLVVGGLYAKWPPILYQMCDHSFQLAFHHREHVGPWYEKVFEICGGKDQHFPGSVHAVEIIAIAVLCHFGPALEVGE